MGSILDRDKYLRAMSDRLHDRFLERPAFLDLEFIRAEINKLDSQIEALMADGLSWPAVAARIGDPSEYADAIFAQRLLSSNVRGLAPRPSLLVTVLKVLFVVAPVNFIFAVGPLLAGLVILLIGWILSVLVVIAPIGLFIHSYFPSGFEIPSVVFSGSEALLLVSIFAIGQMMVLAMIALSRGLVWCVWKWLHWNIAFLRAEPTT